jgi:hypothetical protein
VPQLQSNRNELQGEKGGKEILVHIDSLEKIKALLLDSWDSGQSQFSDLAVVQTVDGL